MKSFALPVCAIISLAGSPVSAQTLQYFKYVNGVPTATTPTTIVANTIDAGTVGTNDTVTIHIFDSTTYQSGSLPVLSAADSITITGTVDGGTVIVGFTDGDVTPTPLVAASNDQGRGVVNLGTANQPVLVFETPGGVDNPSLRDATTLVAWIGRPATDTTAAVGDVAGNIDVGRIYVIDAPNEISGNLTATANDPDGPTVDLALNRRFAIQRVRAGNLISKNITAQGNNPDGETSTASIGQVIVASPDPALRAAGIRGDVVAAKGRIVSVTSTGPMGRPAEGSTPASPISITAWNGVRLIGAVNAFALDPLGPSNGAESFPINRGDLSGQIDPDASVLGGRGTALDGFAARGVSGQC